MLPHHAVATTDTPPQRRACQRHQRDDLNNPVWSTLCNAFFLFGSVLEALSTPRCPNHHSAKAMTGLSAEWEPKRRNKAVSLPPPSCCTPTERGGDTQSKGQPLTAAAKRKRPRRCVQAGAQGAAVLRRWAELQTAACLPACLPACPGPAACLTLVPHGVGWASVGRCRQRRRETAVLHRPEEHGGDSVGDDLGQQAAADQPPDARQPAAARLDDLRGRGKVACRGAGAERVNAAK